MTKFFQIYKKFSLGLLTIFYCLSIISFAAAATTPLDEIGTTPWVQRKLDQYPELHWLLDTAVQATQEGKSAEHTHSWSMAIKGAHYPEFERSVLSLVSLYLIVDGSDEAYARFTAPQPVGEKLLRESFKRLHEFAQSVIKSNPHTLQLLETNLVLGDTGKTPYARDLGKTHGCTNPDHDQFLDECLEKCPDIFPTFKALSKEDQAYIKSVTGLIHFGHLSHVEGGPNMLRKLKTSGVLTGNPTGFDFEVLTHICDVSAALGHMTNHGSKVMTENTYKALEAVRDTLRFLASHTEVEALKYYLKTRAEWLALNRDLAEWPVLARIGSMMRLFNAEEGKALQSSFNHLPHAQQVEIMHQFNPLEDRIEKTPTYVPAVLVNLLGVYEKAGLSRSDAIKKCMSKGMPLMGHILGQYRKGEASQPYTPEMTLNFNKVAGQLRDKPELVDTRKFGIDEKGNVSLEA